jgi:hypothetical protein
MFISEAVKNKQASQSPAGRSVFTVLENSVGPGEYDPQKVYKKPLQTIIKEKVEPEPAVGSVKQQMENYLFKVFDGGNGDHRRRQDAQPEYHQPDVTIPKSLEEIAPFTIDKRDAVFKSNKGRDPLKPSKDAELNPGPGHYNPVKPKNEIIKNHPFNNFGSNAPRETLIGRDIMMNPFQDGSNKQNPSPVKYQINPEKKKQKINILAKVGSSLGVVEE